jgi:hypothetical protein
MVVDTQRSAHYDLKYVAATVGLKVAAQLSGMKAGYAAIANDLQPIEESIVAALNIQGVKSAVRAPYLAYGRELWKKTKLEDGAALTDDAQDIKDKWTTRGLDSGVCIFIALNVFALVVT